MNVSYKMVRAVCVAVLVAELYSGCGVKSPPVPPQRSIPERIVTLHAVSRQNGINLTWLRPERYAGGHRMRDLGKFEILRAEGIGIYHPLAEVAVTDQQRFQQQNRFTYLDSTAQIGISYRYEIVAETLDGYPSAPSNEVEITHAAPKPVPDPEHFVLPTPAPLP